MFIWQLILNALGLLVLVIICGFVAIAVKSFIKELKNNLAELFGISEWFFLWKITQVVKRAGCYLARRVKACVGSNPTSSVDVASH